MEKPELPIKLNRLTKFLLGRQLDQTIQALEARQQSLDERERYLNSVSQDLQKKQSDLNQKETNLERRERSIASKEREAYDKAQKAEAILGAFRESEKIPPSIKDASLIRDKTILRALKKIKEAAEAARVKHSAVEGTILSPEDQHTLNMDVATLKASLIATVAVYRDTLPEGEIPLFSINNKSVQIFLKEQLDDILQLTNGSRDTVAIDLGESSSSPKLVIDRNLLRLAGKTYQTIADGELRTWAERAYPTAAYDPFESNFADDDSRSVSNTLIRALYLGQRRSMDLQNIAYVGRDSGGHVKLSKNESLGIAGSPRATIDPKIKPTVETEMQGVLSNLENIDQDIEK